MVVERKHGGSRRPSSNLRLRRLTQAYLAPIRLHSTTAEKSAIDEVDSVYYKGSIYITFSSPILTRKKFLKGFCLVVGLILRFKVTLHF